MKSWLKTLERVAAVEHYEREREATLPHIVVCEDPVTGAATFSGPYATRAHALAVARRETVADRRVGSVLVFSAEPLYPAGPAAEDREPEPLRLVPEVADGER